MRLPQEGVAKPTKRVKATSADFEFIEQRVQFPPEKVRLRYRLSAAGLENKARGPRADELFEKGSNVRM
jgi:hypothetical protein